MSSERPATTTEFHDLVRCAENGDFDAQYNLAELYGCGGYGVLRNYIEAEKWYLPGAEQGREDAQIALALLYLSGLGKRSEGMRLLALAGKQGSSCACYELAKAHLQSSGPDRDPVAAYVWFCLAEAFSGGSPVKEIRKLESELSTEQILGAQLRARQEFQPLVVLAAAEEAQAFRAAEKAVVAAAQEQAQQAEFDRLMADDAARQKASRDESNARIRAAGSRPPAS